MKKKQTRTPAPVPASSSTREPELPMDRAARIYREGIDRLAAEAQPLYPDPGYLDALCVAASKSNVSLHVNLRTGQVEVHAHIPYAAMVGGFGN